MDSVTTATTTDPSFDVSATDALEAPLPGSPPSAISRLTSLAPEAAKAALVGLISALQPKICTKLFVRMPSGEVLRRTYAEVYEGTVEIRSIDDLAEFAVLLESLKTNQCLTYGVPPVSPLELVTQERWIKLGQPATHVARTTHAFKWPSGPGVLMLDYDAPKDGTAPLDRDGLVAAVRAACPGLVEAAMLWWPSTSSCIFDGDTGEEINGIRGQRLYLLVQDARDIERAGKALLTHLWAAGHGRFEVSKSGSLLERGLFDASVWQSNHIDFASGARCTPPLEHRRRAPLLIPGSVEVIDTAKMIPDPSHETLAMASARRAAARAAVAGESNQVRAAYVEKRAIDIVERAPETSIEQAREQAVRAVERGVLSGDWLLRIGNEHVKVLDVLDNPDRYHGKLTLDPIEPDYDGGRAVGKLYLYGARPNLYSFAHGGTTYMLERQPERIELVRGRAYDATNAVLNRMRKSPDVFDFGGDLVTIAKGQLARFDEHALRYWLGGTVQFFSMRPQKGGGFVEVLEDPPFAICKAILSLRWRRGLRSLAAIISAPTLRPDGSALTEQGYDADTRLFLMLDDDEVAVPVPDSPTREQAAAALATLMKPFEKFPFVGSLDRAAHLAALLTAVVRPSLPTAPAFAYDAPSRGSGKSLLAKCVAVQATGALPDVWPPLGGREDDEMRKRITTALRDGRRVVVLDNLVGTFDSASLAAALTSAIWSDRILGVSEACTIPNNTMFLLNGNNMSHGGDMPRRILTCRIDPQCASPFDREFDLDPERYCIANRQLLVAAALTLLRFYLASGVKKPGAGRMASFEAWDDWVRQAIIYIDRELAVGQFGDVMDLVKLGQANDPEQETLMQLLGALRGKFGEGRFTAAEAAAASHQWPNPDPASRALAEAFSPFRRGSDPLSAQSLGHVLKNRKDRIAGTLRLEGERNAFTNAMVWRVRTANAGVPLDPVRVPPPWKTVVEEVGGEVH